MIASISWIPKGVTKPVPESAEPPSKEEIEKLIKSGFLEGSEEGEQDDQDMDAEAVEEPDKVSQALVAANALGNSSKSITSTSTNFDDIADGLQELSMDNYDEEDDGIELFSKGLGNAYYLDNSEDPYLKDKDGNDSEELEDMIIEAEDSVIICARNEEEDGHLEMWILEEIDDDKNMFIHHSILLQEFLLCTAWLDCPIKGGEKGNFIAVGSMEPAIEIWDLDIMDEVQPSQILGGIDQEGNEKIKNEGTKESIKYKKGSHTDSVLGLAWNKENRNILASASADKSVKIWDVATGECNITMEHHTDKVQSVAWNHHAPQVLLSGSFDHSVVMKDRRIPKHTGFKWSVDADVESLAWNPHNEHSFVVSLENGTVTGFDIRAPKTGASSGPKPSFTLHAHDKAVSSISYNPLIPNLLATGSTDTLVKLWDLSNDKPSCVASKNPKAGAVFSIAFSEDSPFLLAIGGSKGKLKVWDTITDAGISWKYGKYSNKKKELE